MGQYECSRCTKKFKRRSNYDRHLTRKNLCKIFNSVTIYECCYCNKTLATNSNLHRHYRKCKNKQDYDESIERRNEHFEKFLDKFDQLENENSKLKNELRLLKSNGISPANVNNANINNGTINNNNIYYDQRVLSIKINPFGEEDMSYLKDNMVNALLGKPGTAVETMVKETHCNEKHPENNNTYISNKRDNTVIVFDGHIWIRKDKDEVIEKVIDNSFGILENRYDDLVDQVDHDLEKLPKQIRRFEILRDWYDELDPKMNNIKTNTEIILHNNKTRSQELRRIKGM
jgi:hypothetical protein